MPAADLSIAPHPPLDLASATFFIAIAIAALVATLRRPANGIAALILADPFDKAHAIGWLVVTIPQAVLAGVVLGLLARRAPLDVLREREIRPLLGAAVVVAFVTGATIVASAPPGGGDAGTLTAFEYLAAFIAATVAFADDPDEAPIWMSLGVVTAAVSASALEQEVAGTPPVLMLFGHGVPRIAGLLEGPDQLAGFFDIAVPLLLARALGADRRTSGQWFAAAVTLGLVTDVLTFSRAGLLGAAAGIFAVAFRERAIRVRRNRALAAGAACLAAAAAAIAFGPYSPMLATTGSDATTGIDTTAAFGLHGDLSATALGFWRAHPWLFAAYVFAFGAAIRAFFLRAPRAAIFVGAGAATIALATHQLFDLLLFSPKIGGFWWLWLGIASGASFARSDPP